MLNINGNTPSLKNSKIIDQAEIQNVKQNLNSTAGKNMILGAQLTSNLESQTNMTNSVPSLNSSTPVGTKELQNVRQNMNTTPSQVSMTNSAPSLNSSTSVGTKEIQKVKNEIQKSGNNKRLF